jgi:hypothetical protein
MTTPFHVYGPFELDKEKIHEKKYQKTFWEAVEDKQSFLSGAQGVYLFSICNGNNFNPIYTGITKRLGFKKEALNTSNILRVKMYQGHSYGALYLHCIAKPNAKNRGFSKNISSKTLSWVEVFFIFLGRRKNKHFMNRSHTAFLDTCEIANLTGHFKKGPAGEAINTFRNALDL